MGVVSDIERQLGRLRAREADDGMPELRTSTMTHIVWCPPEWRAEGARDARRPARAPSGPHDLPDPVPGRRGEDRGARGAEGLPAAGPLARGALRGDRAPAARLRRAASGLDRAAAARLRPARLLPLARRARLGERASSPRSSASPTGSSSTPRSGAACRPPTRAWRSCSTASPSRTSPSRGRCPGAARRALLVWPLARRASWGSVPLAEIVGVTDRLVVDSSEWREVPKAYALPRGSVRQRRRLGHRVLAHAALAAPARRALAGDRHDREAARRRARAPTPSSSPAGSARG